MLLWTATMESSFLCQPCCLLRVDGALDNNVGTLVLVFTGRDGEMDVREIVIRSGLARRVR